MRDRLVEILEQADFDFGEHSAECAFENVDSENYYRFIADRLLAEGVIVPPFKVGDTVFVVSQGAGFSVVWNVYEAKVTDIHIDRWGKLSICVKTARTEIGGYCDTENVFHTREEAEKALAERSEE